MTSTTSLRDFGFAYLGPLLTQYYRRLASETAPDTTLVCLAREGFLFRRIAHELRQRGFLRVEADLIYLQVSRLVLFKAALASPDFHHLCVATKFEGPLQTFLQGRLGLSAGFVENEFSANELSKTIKLPKHAHTVLDVLARHGDALTRETSQTAEGLKAYLHSLGLPDAAGQLLFMDLGFSGTIQQLLTNALQRDTHGLYIMASNAGKTRVGRWTAHMSGSFSEGVRIGDGYKPVDRSLFFECLLTAPHGPVMDIREQNDGSFSFVYGPCANGQRHRHSLEQVFLGATEAVIHAFEHDIGWDTSELESLLERQVSNLWCLPAGVRGLFNTDDSVCGNGLLSPIRFYRL